MLSPDEEAELEASEWRRLAVAVWRLLPAQRCGLSVLAFVIKALIRCLLFLRFAASGLRTHMATGCDSYLWAIADELMTMASSMFNVIAGQH